MQISVKPIKSPSISTPPYMKNRTRQIRLYINRHEIKAILNIKIGNNSATGIKNPIALKIDNK